MSNRTVTLIAALLTVAVATPSLAFPQGGSAKFSPGHGGGGGGGFKAPGPGGFASPHLPPNPGPKLPPGGGMAQGGLLKIPGGGYKPGYSYGAAALAGGLAVGALAAGAASADVGECWIERRQLIDDYGNVFTRRVRICE